MVWLFVASVVVCALCVGFCRWRGFTARRLFVDVTAYWLGVGALAGTLATLGHVATYREAPAGSFGNWSDMPAIFLGVLIGAPLGGAWAIHLAERRFGAGRGARPVVLCALATFVMTFVLPHPVLAMAFVVEAPAVVKVIGVAGWLVASGLIGAAAYAAGTSRRDPRGPVEMPGG